MRTLAAILRTAFGLALCAAAAAAAPGTAAENTIGAKRRFEVRDAIEMSYFGTIASSQRDHLADDGIVSPDGRYTVKVTHRGVLPEGVTEATIWLFETRAVIDAVNDPRARVPEPAALARMSAAANGVTGDFLNRDNIVSELAWSSDGASLTFLGRNGRENRQLFRLDLATRSVKAMTPESQDVVTYAASKSGFAYLAADGIDEDEIWRSAGSGIPDIDVGTGQALIEKLYPRFRANDVAHPLAAHVWRVRNGRAEPVIEAATKQPVRVRVRYDSPSLSLSQDGSMLATVAHGDASDSALYYTLIDLDAGRTRTLDAAKVMPRSSRRGRLVSAWSPDGGEVALAEIQDDGSQGGEDPRQRGCEVGIMNVRSEAVRCIVRGDAKANKPLRELRWLSPDRVYINRKTINREEDEDVIVERRNGAWGVPQRARANQLPRLRFTIHESLNERPVLIAHDLRTGRQRRIFDPNPQLDSVELGVVSVYEWQDAKGRTHRGGLVMPPDRQPGRRYPLVVQTHGFDPNRFFRSGYSDTSNAGRALAARDIVVIQVREPSPQGAESWRDATELGLDVYLAAIDALAADGLIDPNKVGISGYSYTGWTTATSLVRAPDRFAAAVIANTDPITTMGYFAGVDSHIMPGYEKAYVGAQPFGSGAQAWIERVPTFASDRIQAAVLFSAADPWHLISSWELYAALRRQQKPVELQYIRSGQHNISKPLHKLAHQEIIVDWFEFWLADREHPDPKKAEQYARWRKLKERESR